MAVKDLGLGAIIGLVCYQRRRIVTYSAYIFKALGVTSAWGLCGMHSGTSAVVILSFAFFPRLRGEEMVNLQIKTWKSVLHLNSLIFVLES